MYYDEQFRFIQQSAPEQYPWEAIHWELWLKAVTNFRPKPQFTLDRAPFRSSSQSFPKAPAGVSMPARCAMDVDFSTSVSSVAPHTLPRNVYRVNTKGTLVRPALPIPQCHKPVTPVKVDRLKFFLNGYNASLAHFLVNGFTFGFSVGFIGKRRASQSPNLKSAIEQPQAVWNKLRKETEAGRIRGPFCCPPFPNFVCLPLGIVPKKDPSEFRLIQHLSFPFGNSVNDFIPVENSSVRYTSISDAIVVIKNLGAGCFMAKTDIKSAFRIIPIHPSNFPLLGMK